MMRLSRGIFNDAKVFACLLACLSSVWGPARAEEPPPLEDLAAEVDRVVSPYVAVGDFMGVVAIQRDGEPALFRSYGLASVELAAPHDAKSIFLIGSISKQFTAAAILLLEQEGKLATSDSVRQHLPNFKPDAPITIEQLLTHTSGVADVYSLSRFGETEGQGGSFDEVVGDLNSMGLTHDPGTTYAYSNGGYSVLAAIIEKISGMSYGDFLRDRFFDPLRMTSTSDDDPEPVVRNRVPGYDPWGISALTPALPPSEAYTTGSGSLWSCAADLLAWNSALHRGRLLTAISYEKLTRDYGYGYGFGVSVFDRFGRTVIGHDGRIAGYATDVARYVGEETTIAILSNVQSNSRDEIRRSVAAVVFGEEIDPIVSRAFSDRSSAESLTELAGVYSFGPGFDVTISHRNGRLLARANEGGESELLPLANGTWFSRVLYATVRFGREESGQVDRLIWGSGENAPVGVRRD